MAKYTEESVYEYIKDCILNQNFSPTVREICSELKIPSTSTVHYYLQSLAEKGLIVKDDIKKRTIKLNLLLGQKNVLKYF